MHGIRNSLFGIVILLAAILASEISGEVMKVINLPKVRSKGSVSVEEAIWKRRSMRSYSSKEVSAEDLSQLLWACQGITDERLSFRAAPSAGALYPLEIYLVKDDGIFHYVPNGHRLEKVSDKDMRAELAKAAYGQNYVKEAAVDMVICAVYERVTSKYGERGIRYTDMEAGHAAQNVFLQAEVLDLSSVPVGAFSDGDVSRILKLSKDTKPLYILPVGYKR